MVWEGSFHLRYLMCTGGISVLYPLRGRVLGSCSGGFESVLCVWRFLAWFSLTIVNRAIFGCRLSAFLPTTGRVFLLRSSFRLTYNSLTSIGGFRVLPRRLLGLFSNGQVVYTTRRHYVRLIFPMEVGRVFRVFVGVLSIRVSPLGGVRRPQAQRQGGLYFLFMTLRRRVGLFFVGYRQNYRRGSFKVVRTGYHQFRYQFGPSGQGVQVRLTRFPSDDANNYVTNGRGAFYPLIGRLSYASSHRFPCFFFFFYSM